MSELPAIRIDSIRTVRQDANHNAFTDLCRYHGRFYLAFRSCLDGHTFAGNPLASAVGIAVIDEIVEKGLDRKAEQLGQYLVGKLEGLEKYGVVREIRGKGLLRGVEMMRDGQDCPELGQALKKTALANGLIMRIDPLWFSMAPALISTEDDIDELYSLIEKSIVDALQTIDK